MLLWILTWVLLVAVITIHELGHAGAAKIFNIPIVTVNLGIGKTLVKYRTQSGTAWHINVLPLGGAINIADAKISFASKLLTIISGSLLNIICAWIMLIIATASFKTGSFMLLGWLYKGVMFLGKLLTLSLTWPELNGPFMWFELLKNTLAQGMQALLTLLAALNVILGITNLLPFPGLDGAEVIYCLIAKIRSKPVSLALQRLLMELFWIAMLVFLAQVTIHDAMRHGYI
jgi:membrane-associated protease RseP (regulator of RpoE activity)